MSEKITFQELVESIADQTNNSQQFTHGFLKDFVDVVNDGLDSDGTIYIAGFGKFELRPMNERDGYNPQTGEKITIPAHNKIVFKPYKDLRELVNAPYSSLEAEIIGDEAGENYDDSRQETKQDLSSPPSAATQNPPGEQPATNAPKAPWEQAIEDTKDDDFAPEYPVNMDGRENEPAGFPAEKQKLDADDGDVVEYVPDFKSKSKNNQAQPAEAVETSPDTRKVNPESLQQKASSSPSHQKSDRGNKRSQNRVRIAGIAFILLLLTTGAWYFITSGNLDSYDTLAIKSEEPAAQGQGEQAFSSPSGNSVQSSSDQQNSGTASSATDQTQQSQPSSTATKLIITEGQTLWSLAGQQYDDPYLWPWIYDENKASISNPDLILTGQTLALPLPGGTGGGLSSQDSLHVAMGYIETYRWYKNHGYEKAKFYLYAAKMYKNNVFDYSDVSIDAADLAFADSVR